MMDLFNILKDVPDVYAMRGDYLIFHACLPKAKALRKETWAVCKTQLISSPRFKEHLKQPCTHNSERQLWTLVVEKDRSRKTASIREGTD